MQIQDFRDQHRGLPAAHIGIHNTRRRLVQHRFHLIWIQMLPLFFKICLHQFSILSFFLHQQVRNLPCLRSYQSPAQTIIFSYNVSAAFPFAFCSLLYSPPQSLPPSYQLDTVHACAVCFLSPAYFLIPATMFYRMRSQPSTPGNARTLPHVLRSAGRPRRLLHFAPHFRKALPIVPAILKMHILFERSAAPSPHISRRTEAVRSFLSDFSAPTVPCSYPGCNPPRRQDSHFHRRTR